MPAQPEPTDRAEVHKLASAVEEVLAKEMQTRYLNPDLPSWEDGSRIGTTPAVRQPGAAPMSQQATDISKAAMYCGLATVPPGLIAIGVIVASEHANPTVIGMVCAGVCAAPAAFAFPILALGRLMRRAKESVEAAPPEHHHHYGAPVYQDQRNIDSRTSGIWAKTNNQQ